MTLTAVAVALAALAGCRTAPPPVPETLAGYLPERARAYVYVDVARAPGPAGRILAEAGVAGRDARRILDRTARVAAALGPPAEAGGGGAASTPGTPAAGFVLAASGRFPGFVIESQLAGEEGWRRRRVDTPDGPRALWRREPDGLELSFPAPRLVLVGSGGVERALSALPAGERPGARTADAHAAVLAVAQLETAAPFGGGRIEMQDLELRANPVAAAAAPGPGAAPQDAEAAPGTEAAPDWRIDGELRFADEGTARAMTALIRLFAISLISETGADPGEAAADLAIDRDGTVVTLGGIVIAERYLLDALGDFLSAQGAAVSGAMP